MWVGSVLKYILALNTTILKLKIDLKYIFCFLPDMNTVEFILAKRMWITDYLIVQ